MAFNAMNSCTMYLNGFYCKQVKVLIIRILVRIDFIKLIYNIFVS